MTYAARNVMRPTFHVTGFTYNDDHKTIQEERMFKRVDDIFFNVDDIDKAVAFYRDRLGLPVKYQSADWVELDAGNVTIALRRYGSGPEGRPELGVGEGATIVFEVDDIQATKAELEGQGVKFVGGVFDYGAVKLAAFQDLNGNVLQIYQHVR
jgi:catechol 2,3-dioxygenase-like lactoylglutathione lyase family enzyme